MDTTTTTETATEVATAEATATETKAKETSLGDEIWSLESRTSYIEHCVDGEYTLREGDIEDALEKCFDLKKKAKTNTTEWRMIRRVLNRLIACATDTRRI